MSEFIVFNEKNLAWALKRARYTAGDLVKRISFYSELVRRKTKADNHTNSEAFPISCLYLLVIFALPSPPEEIPLLPDFRTKGNHPVKEISLGLRKTIEHAKECQAFLSERLENADAEPFLYEGVLSQHNTPKRRSKHTKRSSWEKRSLVARKNRFKNLLPYYRKFRRVNTKKNSHVLNSIKHKLDSDEFRGFALCDKYCPL